MMIRRFVYRGKERWQVSFRDKNINMRVIFDAFDSYEEAVKASKILKLNKFDYTTFNGVEDYIANYFLIKEQMK